MKLFLKVFDTNYYSKDIEISVIRNKTDVIISETNNQINLYYIPVKTNLGIKMEPIIFPINGKYLKKKYIFYFNLINCF